MDADFSQREIEVLVLCTTDLKGREIADFLYISPRTISQHLQRIYRKLGVRRRAAAVRVAGQLGVIDVPALEAAKTAKEAMTIGQPSILKGVDYRGSRQEDLNDGNTEGTE